MSEITKPAELTREEIQATQEAIQFHSSLAVIPLQAVPVLSTDRNLPRKLQAKLARDLFKQFGLRGVSVTAPSYANAQSVHVSIPRRRDYLLTQRGMVSETCPVGKANSDAQILTEKFLLAAFPNSDNRSDGQSDHYDYRWTVNTR